MNKLAIAILGQTVFIAHEENGIKKKMIQELEKAQDLSNVLLKILDSFSFQNIQALGVIRGPGSFTGLRVLLSTIHGLMLGFPHLRVFCPTFFEVVASYISDRPLIVLGDPHNDQQIGQIFSNDSSEIFITAPKEEAKIIVLSKQEEHWSDKLLSMEWHLTKSFPLPFYGYEPLYKKVELSLPHHAVIS